MGAPATQCSRTGSYPKQQYSDTCKLTGQPSRAPAGMRTSGAYSIDMLEFNVAPGTYNLTVAVKDSVSGKQLESTVPVEAYGTRPDASDLMLASAMRTAAWRRAWPISRSRPRTPASRV